MDISKKIMYVRSFLLSKNASEALISKNGKMFVREIARHDNLHPRIKSTLFAFFFSNGANPKAARGVMPLR